MRFSGSAPRLGLMRPSCFLGNPAEPKLLPKTPKLEVKPTPPSPRRPAFDGLTDDHRHADVGVQTCAGPHKNIPLEVKRSSQTRARKKSPAPKTRQFHWSLSDYLSDPILAEAGTSSILHIFAPQPKTPSRCLSCIYKPLNKTFIPSILQTTPFIRSHHALRHVFRWWGVGGGGGGGVM